MPIAKNTPVEHNGKTWTVAGMVYLPNGEVDWYRLVPSNPRTKDPFEEAINVPAKELENKPRNTAVGYLYRDAHNYKKGGVIILTGVPAAGMDQFEREVRNRLDGGEHFIADQIGVPEVFLWNPEANYDPEKANLTPKEFERGFSISDADHCWHEWDGATETTNPPTDPRTPEEFLQACQTAAAAGWKDFDPKNRGAREKVR